MIPFCQYIKETRLEDQDNFKSEQECTDAVNRWLDKNGLTTMEAVHRQEESTEILDEASNYESDVEILDGDKTLCFLEYKMSPNENILNYRFKFNSEGNLEFSKKDVYSNEIYYNLMEEINASEEYSKFKNFITSEYRSHKFIDIWLNEESVSITDVVNLAKKYNDDENRRAKSTECNIELIKKGNRPSFNNRLFVALNWWYENDYNYDICTIEGMNMTPYVIDHYSNHKNHKVQYIQLGNSLYMLDENDNPLQLQDVPMYQASNGLMTVRLSKKETEVPIITRCNGIPDKESPVSFIDSDIWPNTTLK